MTVIISSRRPGARGQSWHALTDMRVTEWVGESKEGHSSQKHQNRKMVKKNRDKKEKRSHHLIYWKSERRGKLETKSRETCDAIRKKNMRSVPNECDTRSSQSKESVRTPVTHGEGVRHLHTLEEVSLPRPICSCVANVGESYQIMYARGARCKMPCHEFVNHVENRYEWFRVENMRLKHGFNAQHHYQCSEHEQALTPTQRVGIIRLGCPLNHRANSSN